MSKPAPHATPIRGQEDREHAFCIGPGEWPSSCAAPATYALRIAEDAHGRPYEVHYCTKHGHRTSSDASAFRYRSDEDAALALPAVEAYIMRTVHPNDQPRYIDRARAATR